MLKGRGIEEVVKELERQNVVKKDYLCDTNALTVKFKGENKLPLLCGINGDMQLTEHAHGQLASFLKIPMGYYSRLRLEEFDLFEKNINTWLERSDKRKLVRTLDNKVRAFLPYNYRPTDCLDLVQGVTPVFDENGLKIISAEITETRCYVKTILDVPFEIKSNVKDDIVQMGIAIRGSEVGAGGVKVEPFVNRVVCTNGMIASKSMSEYALTKGDEGGWNEITKYLTKETLAEINKAFLMKLNDVIRGIMQSDSFMKIRERLEMAFHQKVDVKEREKFIHKVISKVGVSKQKEEITKNFMEEGDFSRYGVLNAITRAANVQVDYDIATSLEYAGDKVLTLSDTEWRVLQEAK